MKVLFYYSKGCASYYFSTLLLLVVTMNWTVTFNPFNWDDLFVFAERTLFCSELDSESGIDARYCQYSGNENYKTKMTIKSPFTWQLVHVIYLFFELFKNYVTETYMFSQSEWDVTMRFVSFVTPNMALHLSFHMTLPPTWLLILYILQVSRCLYDSLFHGNIWQGEDEWLFHVAFLFSDLTIITLKRSICYMWNWVGRALLCSSFIVFALLIYYFLWLSISRRLDDFLFSKLAFMETEGDSASLLKFIFSCKFHVMLAYFWLIDSFWRIGVATIRLCLTQLQILVYWVTRGIDLELSQ